MKAITLFSLLAVLALSLMPKIAFAQIDPGVQGGGARAGLPLPSVTAIDGSLQFFQNGQSRFQDVESVSNSPTGNNGLGPRFNFVQCSGCHAQPAVGGTGPAANSNDQRLRHSCFSTVFSNTRFLVGEPT